MTTTPDTTSRIPAHEHSWRILTGRLAEWTALLEAVDERRGLTVLASDPWSGTTGLLEQLAGADQGVLPHPPLLVDARCCADAADLATAIADGAVARWAPQALASWTGTADQYGEQGLRLARRLTAAGVDTGALKDAGRDPGARLRAALDLVAALGAEHGPGPTLAIDHLGRMLSAMRAGTARSILETIRAARQAQPTLNLLLADYASGPIHGALADREHPLYQAGGTIIIRRASADRISGDLIITKPQVQVQPAILHEAAVVTDGVPQLAWQVTELAYAAPDGDAAARAQQGWQQLRHLTEPVTRRQWDTLRHLHSAAQPVAAALALGHPPHALPLGNKTIRDALVTLRAIGAAWQPEPRTWHLADPLLAEWIVRNPPPRQAHPG